MRPRNAQGVRPCKRVKELDSIRGLAALAIVIYHLWFPAVGVFGLAVDLFFVLSGYLITTIILDNALTEGFLLLLLRTEVAADLAGLLPHPGGSRAEQRIPPGLRATSKICRSTLPTLRKSRIAGWAASLPSRLPSVIPGAWRSRSSFTSSGRS